MTSRPDYYVIPLVGRDPILAMDVTDALRMNFNLGCVLKYVVRQGRKPGNSALQDLKKAQDCLSREMALLETCQEETRA